MSGRDLEIKIATKPMLLGKIKVAYVLQSSKLARAARQQCHMPAVSSPPAPSSFILHSLFNFSSFPQMLFSFIQNKKASSPVLGSHKESYKQIHAI